MTTRVGLLTAFLMIALSACTGVRALPAAPVTSYEKAEIPGFSKIRIWGDSVPKDITDQLQLIRNQIAARSRAERKVPNGGRFDILVLSGGGTDGAFGAGVLNGWTANGGRPEFGLVTGISTGALIAPYAFLGAEYDIEIERFYTNTETDDLLDFTVLDAIRGKNLGVSDPSKLRVLVEKALTPRFLAAIAAEHAKGRRLWVGTTNLDAQRPVTWDIGAIASSGNPGARKLIGEILLASAAIPGAFPPVQIAVEADGKQYSEMHVDGGVTRQLFLYPADLNLSRQPEDRISPLRKGTIWVIRNTKLTPEYDATSPGVIQIASRSISTLLKAAGVADVQVVRAQAARDGWGLRLIAVPRSFRAEERELFDPVYMRALFETGYASVAQPGAWEIAVKTPK